MTSERGEVAADWPAEGHVWCGRDWGAMEERAGRRERRGKVVGKGGIGGRVTIYVCFINRKFFIYRCETVQCSWKSFKCK